MKVILSIASYRDRFNLLELVYYSLIAQTYTDFIIELHIPKSDSDYVPTKLKSGNNIRIIPHDPDIKSYKKWYSGVLHQDEPNTIIITGSDCYPYYQDFISSHVAQVSKYPQYFHVGGQFPYGIFDKNIGEVKFDKKDSIGYYMIGLGTSGYASLYKRIHLELEFAYNSGSPNDDAYAYFCMVTAGIMNMGISPRRGKRYFTPVRISNSSTYYDSWMKLWKYLNTNRSSLVERYLKNINEWRSLNGI